MEIVIETLLSKDLSFLFNFDSYMNGFAHELLGRVTDEDESDHIHLRKTMEQWWKGGIKVRPPEEQPWGYKDMFTYSFANALRDLMRLGGSNQLLTYIEKEEGFFNVKAEKATMNISHIYRDYTKPVYTQLEESFSNALENLLLSFWEYDKGRHAWCDIYYAFFKHRSPGEFTHARFDALIIDKKANITLPEGDWIRVDCPIKYLRHEEPVVI